LNKEDAFTVFHEGMARYEDNDFDGAFAKFKLAVQLRPGNARYWKQLVHAANELDTMTTENTNAKEVEGLIDEFLQQHPTHAWMYLIKVRLLQQQDEFQSEEARALLDTAVKIDPKLKEAYDMRSRISLAQRRYRDAINDLDRRIELDSKDWDAYKQRGLSFYHLKDYQEAERAFGRAIHLNRKEALIYHYRARLYFAQRLYEKADLDIRRALSIAPSSIDAQILRAHILMRSRKTNEALTVLSEVEKDKMFAFHRLNIAEAYICLGQPQRAIDILQTKEPHDHVSQPMAIALMAIAEVLLGKKSHQNIDWQALKKSKEDIEWDWIELELFADNASDEGLYSPESLAAIKNIIKLGKSD
jgi:tetratricopeptide (TPR) repeat protein